MSQKLVSIALDKSLTRNQAQIISLRSGREETCLRRCGGLVVIPQKSSLKQKNFIYVPENMYKGHMDKTKEGVGSRVGNGDDWSKREWYGGNGDNCT